VHKLLVLTSGPNAGAAGYVAADVGAKTAIIPKLLEFVGFTAVEPTPGDTFSVYQQTVMSGGVRFTSPGGVFMQDIEMTNVAGFDLYVYGGQSMCLWCAMSGILAAISDWGDFYSCLLASDSMLVNGGGLVGSILCVLATTSGTSVERGARLEVGWESIVDGGGGGGVIVKAGGRCDIQEPTAFLNFGPAGKPLVVGPGGVATITDTCWGETGNSPAHWLWVDCAGNVVFSAAAYLAVEGSPVTDVAVGTRMVTNAVAGAGVVDATVNASCVEGLGY
jgi:hypothetical protein